VTNGSTWIGLGNSLAHSVLAKCKLGFQLVSFQSATSCWFGSRVGQGTSPLPKSFLTGRSRSAARRRNLNQAPHLQGQRRRLQQPLRLELLHQVRIHHLALIRNLLMACQGIHRCHMACRRQELMACRLWVPMECHLRSMDTPCIHRHLAMGTMAMVQEGQIPEAGVEAGATHAAVDNEVARNVVARGPPMASSLIT